LTTRGEPADRSNLSALGASSSITRKAAAILVPWVFLAAFATLYLLFAVPRMRDGQLLALCLGAFIALVFVVFFVAAVTFSRDVLLDRWPTSGA
jgi:hypothetical protein